MTTQTATIARNGQLSADLFDCSVITKEDNKSYLQMKMPSLAEAAEASKVNPANIPDDAVVKVKIRAASTTMIPTPAPFDIGNFSEFKEARLIDYIEVDARIAKHLSVDLSVINPSDNYRILLAEGLPLYGESQNAFDGRAGGFVHIRISEKLREEGLAYRVVVNENTAPYIELPTPHGDHPGKNLLRNDMILMPMLDTLATKMTYMLFDKDAQSLSTAGRSSWMQKWWKTIQNLAREFNENFADDYDFDIKSGINPFEDKLDRKAEYVNLASKVFRLGAKSDARLLKAFNDALLVE